jgi:Protein of unknown function (DUF3433)
VVVRRLSVANMFPANIPTLVHSASQRSITASDDYYSVSEASLSQASSDDRATVIRYHTPSERPAGHSTGAVAGYNKSGELAQPEAAIVEQAHPEGIKNLYHDEGHDESTTPRAKLSQKDLVGAVQLPQQLPDDKEHQVPGDLKAETSAASAEQPVQEHHSLPVEESAAQAHPTANGHGLGATIAGALAAAGAGTLAAKVSGITSNSEKRASYAADSERAAETPLPEAPGAYPHPSSVRFSEDANARNIPRKTVPSNTSQPTDMPTWQQHSRAGTSPTPGADDTPYIHFAIDQLTRDEELLGRSRDARGSPDMLPVPPSAAVADVSPVSSDDERGRLEVRNADVHQDSASPAADATKELQVTEPVPRSQSVSPLSEQGAAQQAQVAPQQPPPPTQPVQQPADTPRLPPHDHYRYPPLTFIPRSLQISGIVSLIVPCIVFIGLLTLTMIWAAKKGGLWDYDGVGTGRYFLAEYLPQLLAVLVTIYLIVAQRALQRILPFVLLSHKPSGSMRNIFDTIPIYITNFLIPNASWFQPGEPIFAYAAVSFWLHLWTVPLASALYQTRLFVGQTGGWRWTTVQPVAVILIALYLNLIAALSALHYRLRRHPTGLKWDPVSMADVFVLLRKSTVKGPDVPELDPQRASLGYWESPSQPGHFYHGIANTPSTHHVHIEHGKTVARPDQQGSPQPTSRFDSWRSNQSGAPRSVKFRPWFLRESAQTLFSVIALVLMVAFLVVTYRRSALSFGFKPLLGTATTDTSAFQTFSPSNFVFSFVPAVVGMLAPLLWMPIDTMSRVFAPYVGLMSLKKQKRPNPSPYGHLLATYASDPPLYPTIRAISHGDVWVATTALLSLLSWALPILGGGIFTAQFVHTAGENPEEQIVMRPDSGGLSALTVFVVLCALGWIAAWPVTGVLWRGGWIYRPYSYRVLKERELEKDAEAARRGVGNGPREHDFPSPERAGRRAAAQAAFGDWLCGHDVRYLGGMYRALGPALFRADMWREPRRREDLVGRVMAKDGKSRWSLEIRSGARPGAPRAEV